MIKRTAWLLSAALAAVCGLQAGQLAEAAEHRDFDGVRQLLKQKVAVNETQADGSTALLWAAHWNDVDAVRALLKAGADPNAANRFGAAPITEAAALGNAELVKMLLDAGADPDTVTTSDGETVLMIASRAGDAETVKLLLKAGADPNVIETYRGQTALMWAASEEHADVVKLLLDAGADWKVVSYDHPTKVPKLSAASSITPMSRGGLTAMLFAAREGDIDSVKVMLDAGVDINNTGADDRTALLVGIMNKEYTFAKFLLDQGANPNIVDALGRSPLYAAVDMRNEDYSATPARPALDEMPAIDLVALLIEKGADPNAALTSRLPGRSGMDQGDTSLDEGTTPFMRAARAGDAEVMKMLVAAGADPNQETKDGNNAMLFAAGVGYRDKNTTGTERQALEALEYTIEGLGMDITKTNKRGETALHGAASRGADTIVAYLAEQGAALDARSKIGQTPLDVAMGKGSFGLPVPKPTTVALLEKLGAKEGEELPPMPKAAKADGRGQRRPATTKSGSEEHE